MTSVVDIDAVMAEADADGNGSIDIYEVPTIGEMAWRVRISPLNNERVTAFHRDMGIYEFMAYLTTNTAKAFGGPRPLGAADSSPRRVARCFFLFLFLFLFLFFFLIFCFCF